MKRNTWLGLSLAAPSESPGGDRPGEDMPRDAQRDQKPGQNIGITAKVDEAQVKNVFNQKEYLKASRSPRASRHKGSSGQRAEQGAPRGRDPRIYEIPSVRHFDCQLVFPEGGSRA